MSTSLNFGICYVVAGTNTLQSIKDCDGLLTLHLQLPVNYR